MKIGRYYKVKLDYEGKFDDGTVFDSSKQGDHSHPLEFVAGTSMVIKGFDDAVIGMENGEEKEFSINPENAYGEYDPKLKKKISRDNIPPEQEVLPGMMIGLMDNHGRHIPAVITDVDDSDITIDLNHPLAGKKLNFNIKILDVKKGKESDLMVENSHHYHDHHKHEYACGKGECNCEGGECACNSDATSEKEGSCCGGNCSCHH